MPRKYKTPKNKRTDYIYTFIDGEQSIISPDNDSGVTAFIAVCHGEDDTAVDAERRNDYGLDRFAGARGADGEIRDEDEQSYLADYESDPARILEREADEEEWERRREKLPDALETLDKTEQYILTARAVDRRTWVAISETLGVTPNAVRKRYKHITDKLQKLF